jgi:protocatechuate 3,4-dioxygenase, alpha subunit
MSKLQTPSQTVGPYFAYGLTAGQYGYDHTDIVTAKIESEQGDTIRLIGKILDGAGDVIPDAMIEIWQADSTGIYTHPEDPRKSNAPFTGFARCGTGTDKESRFIFDTIKPGAVDEDQAPHINITIFMRGLLSHVFTRIYFSDEETANVADPVLNSVPQDRRNTLVATRVEGRNGIEYHINIQMQGTEETVFFDV